MGTFLHHQWTDGPLPEQQQRTNVTRERQAMRSYGSSTGPSAEDSTHSTQLIRTIKQDIGKYT